MQNLYIFPFNGNALEALDCIDRDVYNLKGFIDDTPEKQGYSAMGITVFSRDILNNDKEAKILAVPGSPASFTKRKVVIESLGIDEERFATVVHPAAVISPLARIGKNVLIMAGVVVTSNAVIGDHVCILPNTVIHHDAHIGDYTLIGSNVTVAGSTTVGQNSYIGSGTSLIHGISVGNFCLAGLGSNVIDNVADYSKVAGNPARLIGKTL